MNRLLTITILLCSSLLLSTTSIAAKSNNLNFKYTNPSSNQLKNLKIKISPDVTIDAGKYLKTSNFKNRKDLKGLFSKQFRTQHLKKNPQYSEIVEALGDRLKVTRTLTLDFKDPCNKRIKKSNSFCFKKTKKWVANKQQKKELDTMRNKIRNKLKTKAIKNAEEQKKLNKILAMNDSQLVGYLLNQSSTEKTIVQTSFLPLIPIKLPANKKIDLTNINKKLVRAKVTLPKYSSKLTKRPDRNIARKFKNIPAITNANTNTQDTYNPDGYHFDNKNHYSINLAMGKRYEDAYGDTYTITFAKKTWWHKRYYANFQYNFGYAFGLQFPFKLNVNTEVHTVYRDNNQATRYPAKRLCNEVSNASEAHLCSNIGYAKIKASPATKSESNEQFYRNAGLSSQQAKKHNEFLFEVGASCSLRLVVPFYSRTFPCPNASINKGQNFKAPLGNNSEETLVNYTLDLNSAKTLGLGVNVGGIGYAVLRPGVRIKGRNGSLVFDVRREFSQITTEANVNSLTLRNQEKTYGLKEAVMGNNEKDWGIKLINPNYRLRMSLVPTVAASIGIGIAGYGWNQFVGPFDLNVLAIELGNYDFRRLNNTPSEHVFIVGRRRD